MGRGKKVENHCVRVRNNRKLQWHEVNVWQKRKNYLKQQTMYMLMLVYFQNLLITGKQKSIPGFLTSYIVFVDIFTCGTAPRFEL